MINLRHRYISLCVQLNVEDPTSRPCAVFFCPERARSLQFDMRINNWKDGLARSLLLNVLVDLENNLTLLRCHVLITPAPYRMAAVSRAKYSLHHDVARH
jgi:hypothetical protein